MARSMQLKKSPQKSNAKGVQKDIKKKPQKTKDVSEKKTKEYAPPDFEVDENARYEGTVSFFNKRAGFGFIKPSEEGLLPDNFNELMVHWKELQSSDRWPYLTKGMTVEFGIAKFMKFDSSGAVLKAKEVCLPGGGSIEIQVEAEDKKEYIGEKEARYLGTVCWYDFKKGFGYIKLDEPLEDVPEEIKVAREEISAGVDAPRLSSGMQIEFGISKNQKGTFSAYNVTLPGGENVTRHIVEERQTHGNQVFKGKVKFWARAKAFGYIIPDSAVKFPKAVKDKMKEQAEKQKEKGKEDEGESLYFRAADLGADFPRPIEDGLRVKFKLYTDSRGCGAYDCERE